MKQTNAYAKSSITTMGSSSSYLNSIFSGYKIEDNNLPFDVDIPVKVGSQEHVR